MTPAPKPTVWLGMLLVFAMIYVRLTLRRVVQ
jgi:hypothetical protein